MKIGFVGLGKMGIGMAGNLVRAGHELTVYNRTLEKAAAFGKAGAVVVEKPADVARDADAVFTMLSDDDVVAEAVFGDDGIAKTLRKGAVHISSSTISTALARKLNDKHEKRGQAYISAPVFGRPDAAEAKKLIVVTAGDANTVERCRPLLDAMGRRTIVAGVEPWQANALKLCGNFMIASMLESFGEGFAVVKKAGMDPHLFLEAMVELFGSPVYNNYGTNVADRKFEPAGFTLKLGLKDVRLALEAAQEVSAPMPFASILRDHFISAMAHGQEQLDWSSLALVAERNAGLEN
ncbi:MAG: NAD(P)-dependent oxidoreductase [Acidobacteriota bacterium]|nr:NAD(P)-dependent oxidoreductase [Acidobacteriota bacterium]MDQ2840060.1 NAD(P)-dependent oxidoreductase [Acidobacteriota bacterium]